METMRERREPIASQMAALRKMVRRGARQEAWISAALIPLVSAELRADGDVGVIRLPLLVHISPKVSATDESFPQGRRNPTLPRGAFVAFSATLSGECL